MDIFSRISEIRCHLQVDNFVKCQSTKDLLAIPGDTVLGRVVTSAETLRYYLVEIPTVQLQRNRIQLRVISQGPNDGLSKEQSEPEESH